MKLVVTILFLVVGAINLLPVIGAFSDGAIQRLYKLDTLSTDLGFLLRHRAFLFSIVGLALISAAFLPHYRVPAALAGAASMGSYVVLFFVLNTENEALAKVAWVDIAALVALALALALHYRYPA